MVILIEILALVAEAIGFEKFAFRHFSLSKTTPFRLIVIQLSCVVAGFVDAYIIILLSDWIFSIVRPFSETFFLFSYSLLSVCCSNAFLMYNVAIREKAAADDQLLRIAKLEASRKDIEEYAYRTSLCMNSHFMLNSLGTLSILIERKDSSATDFCDALMECFRYHLKNARQPLVTLHSELDILKDYMFLMNIRFPDSIILTVSIPSLNSHIPPLALQTLVENALKHNSFSKEHPMTVDIKEIENYIEVSNTLSALPYKEASTGLGLELLQSSYSTFGKEISVETSDNRYIVRVPIID